jgi:hypothetical protein
VASRRRICRLRFNATKPTCSPDCSKPTRSRWPFASLLAFPVSRLPQQDQRSWPITSRVPANLPLCPFDSLTSGLARFRIRGRSTPENPLPSIQPAVPAYSPAAAPLRDFHPSRSEPFDSCSPLRVRIAPTRPLAGSLAKTNRPISHCSP